MPRHIRSVKARHPRKFVKPPTKDARPPVVPPAASPPSHVAPATGSPAPCPAQADLFDGLREAFHCTPGDPETPERTRERYVLAIESLADYLEAIGADPTWVERIDELGWALDDLAKGELPGFLRPPLRPGARSLHRQF